LATIHARAGEGIEQLIKRFQMQCEKEGILKEIKNRMYFQSPSEKHHKKMQDQRHQRRLKRRINESGDMHDSEKRRSPSR